ncbi:SDR family oxidoreductase [Beijerinckia sp. L45]|uniref:SDR family oxidoreductase n=1 Tax=Beijerinckia sp. L45 TaxID=1641855 RepID=UPI00131CA115|nr:SDR family oxidoreductase [Beijerinckia sp. L45]
MTTATIETKPPFDPQTQSFPALSSKMNPTPDHGETSYKGSGRLVGKRVLITGGDSGIGRAVAIAFAREGADLLVSYLSEHDDAEETKRWVEKAGRTCVLVPGDICDPAHCEKLVTQTVKDLGGLDILVNNAAFQKPTKSFDEISIEDWDKTFKTNISAMFYITKFAVPHMPNGGAIVNTSSVNSKKPMATLIPYSATKAAIANFTLGLAQALAEKRIRVNAVLPGPIWTPFIPSGMNPEEIKDFGSETPFKRPGQPAELASAYVMLASDESSYTSGALVVVSGGSPLY